jgi:hypothetical protein
MHDVRQRMNLVVDDSTVLPIGKPTDILGRGSRDDLLNNLFTLTSYDHIDIRTTVKQILNFLRCLITSGDCADLRRKPRNEITNFLESRFPLDAYA